MTAVAYVFKEAEAESEYIAQVGLYRPPSYREEVRSAFAKDRAAQRYLSLARSLGRTPLASEFPQLSRLLQRFGSTQRIERIASSLLSADALTTAKEEKRVNFLLYLAMLRLQGVTPPPVRSLPLEIQADIRMLWPSYKASIASASDFLFDLGRPGRIQEEFRHATVGKRLPDSLYVHKTAEAQLGPLLRLMILVARQLVGEISYDLVKLSPDGKSVTFLTYPAFEREPHPELAYSVHVFLPTASIRLRNYLDSPNPPILHRKEAFLDPLHPRYSEFARLSTQEEELGLLSRPDIGTRDGWRQLLSSLGLRITGTTVVRT